ncbi:hypothetical protein O0L34_g2485 [Tuta absoluta]|nr:hypothetical protein O0L34_g2485 [Tuta absoluta]
MRLILPTLFCILVLLHCSYAPPVSPDKSKEQDSEVKDDLEEYMEYHRYLKEVVQALESDPDFRERLEKADEDDVRSGKIAEQLDFVNHNVRTKLDEIKRRELERLRHLATKQFELTNELDQGGKVPTNEHLDHVNPHTFEIEDLKKLIHKTTADLEAADKQRKEQFKEYEMQKEYEKKQKLEEMEEAQKKEYMDKLKKEEEQKKHHQPLHHPGSKQQLEEVWEKQDHMDQQFDPKAFFMMHDVDGNGVWDADEVKALFIKELDKLYAPNGPNKDLHERAEEMERMREHVFKENDRNRDGLIDFNEFMTETQKAQFNQDEGWKSLDENQVYTQQEYQDYETRRHAEFQYLQQRGLIDARGHPIPGAEHQINQARHQFELLYQQQMHQQAGYQGQQYHHGGQVPGQGYPQQVPQYQVPQGQPQYQQPQPGYHGQQPLHPQQGQYPPQGQFQQPPPGQFQQPPPGQFQQPAPGQFQQPPQDQFHQAAPQGQYHGGQQAPPAPNAGQFHTQQAQGQGQGQAAPPVPNAAAAAPVAAAPAQVMPPAQGQAPAQSQVQPNQAPPAPSVQAQHQPPQPPQGQAPPAQPVSGH